MTTTKQAGRRLRDARKAAGLTQQELADKAGLARMTVVRIENGHQEGANLATLRTLADALGVRLMDLADLEESPVAPILSEYEASPYAQIDKPTPEELEWLKSLPSIVWGEIAPTPASIQGMIQLRRKFPGSRRV